MSIFKTQRSAVLFVTGFCVPRVVVKLGRGKFAIVAPATAKRRGYRVVWS